MFWFADDFNQPLNDRNVSSVGVVVKMIFVLIMILVGVVICLVYFGK